MKILQWDTDIYDELTERLRIKIIHTLSDTNTISDWCLTIPNILTYDHLPVRPDLTSYIISNHFVDQGKYGGIFGYDNALVSDNFIFPKLENTFSDYLTKYDSKIKDEVNILPINLIVEHLDTLIEDSFSQKIIIPGFEDGGMRGLDDGLADDYVDILVTEGETNYHITINNERT